jgi:hypothetical protein
MLDIYGNTVSVEFSQPNGSKLTFSWFCLSFCVFCLVSLFVKHYCVISCSTLLGD